jgi:glutaminase
VDVSEHLTEAEVRRSPDPVTAALGALCDMVRPDVSGDVATYIPELGLGDPEQLGIALVSLVGRRYEAGDAKAEFSIQSISKPFVFALALAQRGLEDVLAHVGAEPTGEAFNAISLEAVTGRPANPMVNAGAIATTALVGDSANRFERILSVLSGFAGRQLTYDQAVYRSEMETADRNRALAYLMRNAGSLDEPVEEVLDAYVRQCSVLVSAGDLAVMAATLANLGQNPLTGEQVVTTSVAEQTCAVMASCGMYDYAGEWMLRVGLPAKSGVSGGLVAVCPGGFGIGLYSPRLDHRGNSVRGVQACQILAERFSLQLVHRPRLTSPVLSLEVASGKQPDDAEIKVLTLQGDLEFPAAEEVVSTVEPLADDAGRERSWLVLDLTRVPRVAPVAAVIVSASLRDLQAQRIGVAVADPLLRACLPEVAEEFESVESAIQWCSTH